MHPHHVPAPGRKPVFKWIMIGLLALAASLFIADHWVHVPQFLPYLLIALCPLMHIFGHGRHGHHGAHQSDKTDGEQG